MQGLWFQMVARAGWWFVPPSLLVVALPSTVSAFHMSQPPENPLVLIVAFVAVVVMTIGVIIAMIRSRSDGRLTKKRGPRPFGKRRGRGRS
jgi:hypothetical protein